MDEGMSWENSQDQGVNETDDEGNNQIVSVKKLKIKNINLMSRMLKNFARASHF